MPKARLKTAKGGKRAASPTPPNRLAELIAQAISKDTETLEEIANLLPSKRAKTDGSEKSPLSNASAADRGSAKTGPASRSVPNPHTIPVVASNSSSITWKLLHAFLSPFTNKMYERFWSRYCSFVHSTNQGLSAIPASFSTVSLFIAHLHEIGLAPATISSHLSAISYYHIILDHPDPCDSPQKRRMLLGCRKLKNTKDNRKPLLHKHINLLLNSNNHVFSDNAYVEVMIKSLILLTYFGFFRMGGITA